MTTCRRCAKLGCAKEGTQRCGGCLWTRDCCKEHQAADWSLHKLFCSRVTRLQTAPVLSKLVADSEKCADKKNILYFNNAVAEQRATSDMGEGIFAVEDIPIDTLILVESPLISAYKNGGSSILALLPIVFKKSIHNTDMLKLLSLSCREIKADMDLARAIQSKTEIVGYPFGYNSHLYKRATCAISSNAFGDNTGAMAAVYHVGSRFNHSCFPNASWCVLNQTCEKDGAASGYLDVYADQAIPKGSQITISYSSVSDYVNDMRKDFMCLCDVCRGVRKMPPAAAGLEAAVSGDSTSMKAPSSKEIAAFHAKLKSEHLKLFRAVSLCQDYSVVKALVDVTQRVIEHLSVIAGPSSIMTIHEKLFLARVLAGDDSKTAPSMLAAHIAPLQVLLPSIAPFDLPFYVKYVMPGPSVLAACALQK